MLGLTACAVGEATTAGQPDAPQPTVPDPAPREPVAERPVPDDLPVAIGVILPRSGAPYLVQYADLVLEGVRLAADSHRGRRIEVVVLDDEGLAHRDAELVAEAQRRGVVAIIGPMLSAGMGEAAWARGEASLALVSPTVSSLPEGLADAYTLNAIDLRGPRSLAEFARRGEFERAAILHPATEEYTQQAWAFRRAFEDAGGQLTAMVPFDSTTTTFGDHIRRIAATRPELVYLPISPRQVQLVAPQLAYYGFDSTRVVVFGNESWAEEEVLRTVAHRFTDSVVVSTTDPKLSGDSGWDDFVRRYEEHYRRSLDNPFPALGYDATRLVLNALDAGGNTPERIAERLLDTRAFRGATGVLSIEGGAVTRAPFIHQILNGTLTPPPPPETLRVLPPVDSTWAGDSLYFEPAGAPLPATPAGDELFAPVPEAGATPPAQ